MCNISLLTLYETLCDIDIMSDDLAVYKPDILIPVFNSEAIL